MLRKPLAEVFGTANIKGVVGVIFLADDVQARLGRDLVSVPVLKFSGQKIVPFRIGSSTSR